MQAARLPHSLANCCNYNYIGYFYVTIFRRIQKKAFETFDSARMKEGHRSENARIRSCEMLYSKCSKFYVVICLQHFQPAILYVQTLLKFDLNCNKVKDQTGGYARRL